MGCREGKLDYLQSSELNDSSSKFVVTRHAIRERKKQISSSCSLLTSANMAMVSDCSLSRNTVSNAMGTSCAFPCCAPPLRQTPSKIKASNRLSGSLNSYPAEGLHEFSWAILPHVGDFLQSDVPQAAFLFNSPWYSA